MNISFNWLSELAVLPESLQDDPKMLAEHLSIVAAATEGIEVVGEELDGILVSRVLEVERHPNADRLSLCKVDRGGGTIYDVVCGAPVIVAGALYPHVAPGGRLPGGFAIEARKIRGELSHGMLCSDIELGLGRDQSGIMRLEDGLEPGTPLGEVLGLPDTRLTLDLNPNRVDLACHLGVAREVTTQGTRPRAFGRGWTPTLRDGAEEASGAGVTVRIDAPERCSRYLAAVVRGVTVGPSPAWLVGRLLAVGARPINNVVDATNYVLLERNQPLHAFDLSTIAGSEIHVRAAVSGEKLTTLDGEEHQLSPGSTVIADRGVPIALAGVMGGLGSQVTAETADVLIECAAFDPMGVRTTGAENGLATDASYRFERGIDVHAQEEALARCVELILAIAGGEADPEGIRVGPPPARPADQRLRLSRIKQVLGLDLTLGNVRALLDPIGIRPVENGAAATGEVVEDDGAQGFSVPGWRTDITREIDLVEEVARRFGYDKFPDEERRFRPSVVPNDPAVEQATRVRRALVANGMLEVRSLSFVPGEYRGHRAFVEVPNPLSADESYLRAAMVPVLLRRLEHNFTRGHRDVRLFEIGTVFEYALDPGPVEEKSRGTERFVEEQRLGIVATGGRRPEHWSGKVPDLDIWDLEGTASDLASRLCGAGLEPIGDRTDDEVARLGGAWLTSVGFRVVQGERTVGVAGLVEPPSVDAPPWAAPVFAMELQLAAVESRGPELYRELSQFPAVRRDLSVTVSEGVEVGALERAVREVASELLESVKLFDVYEGEELGEGRRALGWAFRFRARDRTLTDEDVESEMTAISDALEERFDARIRRS